MSKIRLNPDTETAKAVKVALDENEGFCPCRISRSEDTKCMCKQFREFVKAGNVGLCHCGLYEAYTE